MSVVAEIIFQVEPCSETRGYVARWDAPRGGGITTQGDSFAELDAMIADAVGGLLRAGASSEAYSLAFLPRCNSHRRGKIPRDLSGGEAVRALKRLSLVQLRQTGSHLILCKDSRTVFLPQHKPIKPGTLKGVIEQAGLTLEVFGEER